MDRALEWDRGTLKLLDQSALPRETRVVVCATVEEVAEAIRSMKIRGAPAIGAAAAYGLVLAVQTAAGIAPPALRAHLDAAARVLLGTRPTAVNLRWAVERMLAVPDQAPWHSGADLAAALLAEAHRIAEEDIRTNRAIGANGAALIRPGERILTYCNTGSRATVDYGTALGIIRTAHEQGKRIQVLVSETRPVLQGARLTAWEVLRDGIPATLIADNAAGWLMRRGLVDRVIVGADRVAANGDTATRSGPMDWRCWPGRTRFHFSSPRPCRLWIFARPMDLPSQLKNAGPRRSRTWPACQLLRRALPPRIPRLTSPPTISSPPSSPKPAWQRLRMSGLSWICPPPET